MRSNKLTITSTDQATDHVLVIKEHKSLLWILMVLLLPLCANAQQSPEQLVRDYVSKLDDFLMSPNSFEKRAAFENATFLQGCYFKDDIYIKYKKDSRIEDCMVKDYAGIISEAINANQSHTYAKVEIARSLQTTGSGSRYEVTAYLHYSGAIEMRTVTVFHINNGKISALTNDYIKTKEWNAGDPPDPPVSEGQQSGGGSSSSDTHSYVDLGLPSRTLWATTNIGAANPWDYGDYFAWGETTTKSKYDRSTYKYCEDNTGDKFSKYNTQSKYGSVDNKTTLERSDDAATANWGSDWCMPTLDQIKELKEKCKWVWTTDHGVNGYKVTGPNGNSLFLPAAGYRYGTDLRDVGSYGYYWSRSLSEYYPYDAERLCFGSSGVDWSSGSRYFGFSVRPVRCR